MSGLRRKTRRFKVTRANQIRTKGSTEFVSTFPDVDAGGQITDSEGHSRGRDGHWSGGGPFHSVRSEYNIDWTHYDYNNGLTPGSTNFRSFSGPLCCPITSNDLKGFTFNGKSLLSLTQDVSGAGSYDPNAYDADGATAISRTSPINSNSELGVALLEAIREKKLPSLPGVKTWRDRTGVAKSAGSEYLNHQFGWVPLVSEVTNVASAARNHRSIMQQYERDEGRNVRRRYEFPIEVTVDSLPASTRWASNLPFGTETPGTEYGREASPGALSRTVESVTRKWFVGAFTYATPSSTTSWKKALGMGTEADKLFGLALTPDLLWETQPWSWAVDWFSNTGDVINNVSNFAAQGLVMRYGYMMVEKTTTYTCKIDKSGMKGLSTPMSSKLVITSKTRCPANPFGFGVSWEGLSPTQVAISAALGITRLR